MQISDDVYSCIWYICIKVQLEFKGLIAAYWQEWNEFVWIDCGRETVLQVIDWIPFSICHPERLQILKHNFKFCRTKRFQTIQAIIQKKHITFENVSKRIYYIIFQSFPFKPRQCFLELSSSACFNRLRVCLLGKHVPELELLDEQICG